MGKVTYGVWQKRDQALAKMTEDFYPQLIGASKSFAGRPNPRRTQTRRSDPLTRPAQPATLTL
eukprot:5823011-Prymnesium_polylepis.1